MALALAAATAASCSGDGATSQADAGDAADGNGHTLPIEPTPPSLTPCPSGWREVAAYGLTLCDPWPEGGPEQCALDEAQFPGDAACTQIGSPCPEGDWAEDLPADARVLYVRAGETGGPGTSEAPFGRIGDAIAAARPGTIVAVGKGTYEEVVPVPAGITVWGACVAQTVVVGPPVNGPVTGDLHTGAVVASGREGAVRNLQLTGDRPGLFVPSGTTLRVDDVVITAAAFAGVGVQGELTAERLVVRDSRPHDGEGGIGMAVNDATVFLRQALFDGNTNVSVFVTGPSDVALSDTVIRNTQLLGSSELDGVGLLIDRVAVADVARSVLEGQPNWAVLVLPLRPVSGDAPLSRTLLLRDSVVRSAGPRPDGTDPAALNAFLALVEVQRTWFDGASGFALGLGDHSRLIASDTVVSRTETYVTDSPSSPEYPTFVYGGLGLVVNQGSEAVLERTSFQDNSGVSVWVYGSGSTISGVDVDVAGTRAWPELGFGTAVLSYDGASIDLSDFAIRDSQIGLQLVADGTGDLYDGSVAGNLVGANIQTEPFDLDRLRSNVFFVDNDVNLDSQIVPVPSSDLLPF